MDYVPILCPHCNHRLDGPTVAVGHVNQLCCINFNHSTNLSCSVLSRGKSSAYNIYLHKDTGALYKIHIVIDKYELIIQYPNELTHPFINTAPRTELRILEPVEVKVPEDGTVFASNLWEYMDPGYVIAEQFYWDYAVEVQYDDVDKIKELIKTLITFS